MIEEAVFQTILEKSPKELNEIQQPIFDWVKESTSFEWRIKWNRISIYKKMDSGKELDILVFHPRKMDVLFIFPSGNQLLVDEALLSAKKYPDGRLIVETTTIFNSEQRSAFYDLLKQF